MRHLLDSGADIRGLCGRHGNPLVAASRRCHDDVVDLLLERGADPNFYGDTERALCGYPIAAAARSGSLSIVRKLLDHGADLHHEDGMIAMRFYALDSAITVEHTAMLKFLLEVGAGVVGGFEVDERKALSRTALSRGLDSMVELLQETGITPRDE